MAMLNNQRVTIPSHCTPWYPISPLKIPEISKRGDKAAQSAGGLGLVSLGRTWAGPWGDGGWMGSQWIIYQNNSMGISGS